MKKEKFIRLSTRVLMKEATSKEKEELEEFIKDDKYNDLFLWSANKWKLSEEENDDVHFSLSEGLNKIENDIKEHEPSFSWNENKNKMFSHRLNTFQIAASIIFFIFVSVATLYTIGFFQAQHHEITINEKITKFGQKSILTLVDGTKITLNANSKLKYPEKFGETSREVYLEGEAYFEVVHNSKKPFIVHSAEVSTVVLGTKFNVHAFPDENKIKISLVDGKVEILNKINNNTNEKFLLEPREQFVYNKYTGKRFVHPFEIINEIGWKDNTFIFRNAPLESVLKNLQRAFGVKFNVFDKKNDIKITADFKKAPFWTVVETIKSVAKLDYKIKFKEKEVVGIDFYSKK